MSLSTSTSSISDNEQIDTVISESDIDITISINEKVDTVNENVLLKSLLVLIENSTIGQSLGSIIISLTPDEINILKQIISLSPDSLSNINNGILEIIKDGRIDVMDIPPFIKIIKEIYILSHKEITIKVPCLVTAIGSILKYLLQVILTENKLSSPELVQSCDAIIDVVVDMIKLKSSLKLKSKTCFLNFKFW